MMDLSVFSLPAHTVEKEDRAQESVQMCIQFLTALDNFSRELNGFLFNLPTEACISTLFVYTVLMWDAHWKYTTLPKTILEMGN